MMHRRLHVETILVGAAMLPLGCGSGSAGAQQPPDAGADAHVQTDARADAALRDGAIRADAASDAKGAPPADAGPPLATCDGSTCVNAVAVNDFLDSLGNSLPFVPSLWTYTGTRMVRIGNSTGSADISSMVDLHNNTVVPGVFPGVRADILSAYDGDVAGMITEGQALASAGALLSFEGLNEPNNFGMSYEGQGGAGGSFPFGLSVDTTTGVISGTPTNSGYAGTNIAVDLGAKNAAGATSATVTIAMSPTAGLPLITSAIAVAATQGPFTYQIKASGSPTSYSASNLPSGLSIDTTTGAITGSPPPTSGTWSASIRATNAAGTTTATLTLVLNPAPGTPLISGPAMVTGTVGSAFSYTITATETPTAFAATTSWVPVARYQMDLYAAIKANPMLGSYPVFASSEGGGEAENVGMQWLTVPADAGTIMGTGLKYADFANSHNYICGNNPTVADNNAWWAESPLKSNPNPASVDDFYGEYGVTWEKQYPGYDSASLARLPRVTTETGWNTNPTFDGGTSTMNLSEDQQGKMYLNLYLSAYKEGWSQTFIFGNEQTTYGWNFSIYNPDNTPKLAATYLHNLTTVLADIVSKPAGSLAYSIPNEPAAVHDLLMQKSDGTFYLAVWDERPVGESTDPISVNFSQTFATVNVYDPILGTSAQQTLNNVSSVPLTLSDHAVLLALGTH